MMKTSHSKRLKEAALEYLDQLKTVIPLNGKRAIVEGWAKDDYKPTAEDVEKWFEKFGEHLTGIGLRTGYLDDIFVLDLEVEQDLSKLELSETGVRVKSGRDGIHYYFSDIGEDSWEFTSTSLKKYGIEGDVKGNRQYIVAPPSIHPDTGKEYEWVEPLGSSELQPAPDWLIEILSRTNANKEKWEGVLAEPVKQGNRHNTAVHYAGKLLAHIPEKDWQDVVYTSLASWNDTMCDPPLPSSELNSIYSSLCTKQKAQRQKKNDGEFRVSMEPPLSVSELLLMPESERPTFLVESLIPENGITAIAGHPGCGKSWLMLELAKSVATGQKFLNEFETKQTKALVVDEESGKWEMRRRLELLGYTNELDIYFCCQREFKLDKRDSVSRLIEICQENEIGLIILDPFAALHSGVENNAEEMQEVMSAMQRFNEVGVTVVFIHHHRKAGISGQGQSLRGSSAILGRLDSLVVVEKTSSENPIHITIKHVKSRRGKSADPAHVVLVESENELPQIQLLYGGGSPNAVMKKDRAKEFAIELLLNESLYRDELIEAIKEEEDIGARNVASALSELEQEKVIVSEITNRKKKYSISETYLHIPV
jgi:hypothetical protein